MVDIISQRNTKIRLVRCPGCRKVLPELPDILVYRCGGCDTVLQAKNRKNEVKESGLSAKDTNSLHDCEDDSVSERLEQETTTHSFESSPESGSKGDQVDIENHKSADEKSTDALPSSSELSCHENVRSSPEAIESSERDEYEYQFREDATELRNEALDVQARDRTPSDELINSDDHSLNENEDSSAEIRGAMMQNESSTMGPETVNYTKESQDNCNDLTEDGKSYDDLHISTELSHNNIESSLPGISGRMKMNVGEDRLEFSPSKDQNEYRDSDGDRKSSGELHISAEPSPNNVESSLPRISGRMKMNVGEDRLEFSPSEDQNVYRDSDGDRKSSGELHISADPSPNNVESSLPGISGCMKMNVGEDLFKFSPSKDQNEYRDSDRDRKSSRELHISAEPSPNNVESSLPGVSECMNMNAGEEQLELYPSKDHNECRDSDTDDKAEGKNFLTIDPLTVEGNHQNEPSQGGGADSEGGGSIYHSPKENGEFLKQFLGETESSQDIEFENEASSSALVSSNNVETLTTMPETYADVNEGSESNFRTLTIEGSLRSKKGKELVANQSPFVEGLSENLYLDEKYLEHSAKKVSGFNRVGSDESLVSLPAIPRYRLGAMSRSPTRIYYGYEGNDQTPDQPSHRYRGKFEETELLSTHRSHRTDGYRAKTTWDSELEGHHKQLASSSMFPEKKNHASTGQEWSNNKLPPPRRQSDAIRRTRLDNDDHVSMNPYISRGSKLVHRNGSPSSHRQNMFEHHSGFSSHDTAAVTEPNRLELLRMVYELEDKLNRTHISKWTENGNFPVGGQGYEKHTPSVYDDRATEGGIYPDFINTNEYNIRTQGMGWPKRSNIPRMAFSGEAGYRRHQVDCLCSHCCPRDWQHSDSISRGKFQYTPHPSHHRHQAFSHTLTPKHHSGSQFSSRGEEVKSNNLKYKGHEKKRLQMREKHNTIKRHTRPVAGGSPVIACCHCSELLQLPMDFLVFKRKFHQLRCNSCNQILKFSLQKKGHLVPFVPNASIPSREMVDDNSEAANSTNSVPISNSKRSPYAEPISFSDDYDPSLRSYSTEREPSKLTPATYLQKTTHNGKMSYGGSSHPMKESNMDSLSTNSGSIYRNSGKVSEIQEVHAGPSSPVHQQANRNTNSAFGNPRSTDMNSRKAFESAETSSKLSNWRTIPSEIEEIPAEPSSQNHQLGNRGTNSAFRISRNTDKNSREAFESAETSSKMSNWRTITSEIEELPAESVSPLHELMGYSSPNQVIFGSPGADSDEVTSYRKYM